MSEQFSEPAIVPDTFASGMAEVENLGDGNFRFTWYARQRSTFDRGTIENVIVARTVLSAGAVHTALKQISQALQHPAGADFPEGRSVQ